MGIKGLMTFCRNHIRECSDTVDLIEVARQQDGIVLLVDFYSFEHLIMEHFWSSISKVSYNKYLQFDGGEYISLDAYLSKFINDLKGLGIQFVFFVDGAKGSSEETLKQKLETWKRRHKQDVQRVNEILLMTLGSVTVDSLSPEVRMRPVLLEVQFQATLKNCGCEIRTTPLGEADFVIAKELQTNDKAFAVMSNDSDFLVFQGGSLICKETFDLQGDLQLGQGQALPEKPLRLMCDVIKSEKVAQLVQLTDPNQMVELSILAGNDFTNPFLNPRIYQALGFPKYRSIEEMAEWVREMGYVENSPVFLNEMERNKNFEYAVNHSRKFYNLSLCENISQSEEPVFKHLLKGVEEGVYNPGVLGINNSFYWRRVMIEDTSARHPSSETAMIDLRGYIYRILLPPHINHVMEHGRCPGREYEYAKIYATNDRIVKSILDINPGKIFQNLRHFDLIMSHYEPGAFQKTWFDRYGRKNGFICYILRYFLVLNWGYNLHVSQSEFLALVAMVFGKRDESWYQQVDIIPPTRCVTIGNWFQNVYRHAYLYLGKLLHLTHEFPLPKEIFSGSVWTAFYTCSSEEAWHAGCRQVDRDTLMQCQRDMDAVIKEKRHMIRYLTEHVFDFDDRY